MINPISNTSIDYNIKSSRLVCTIELPKDPLFFSLVDYLNNYFYSEDPQKILEFYESFDDRRSIIQWMKERPDGISRIFEISNESEIIVVIPTSDFHGKFAQKCINIFSGFHIIFVESGGREDYYFNIARNINIGIKKALLYRPKWVIFSGDDIISIDDIDNLRQRLAVINNKEVGIVFPIPFSNYYSCRNNIYSEKRISAYLERILSLKFPMFKAMLTLKDYSSRFRVKYFAGLDNLLNRIFYRKIFNFIDQHTFAIFSAPMLNEFFSLRGYIYNPLYINNREDAALAIDIKNSEWNYETVKLKLKTLKGGTLSNSMLRGMKGLPSDVLFSAFIEELLNSTRGLIT